jgi:hypothetical protein
MNPIVKQLAEQAGGVVLAGSEIQKFAELIVRECAEIAWEDSERYATIDNDTIMNGKADVLALCSHRIKEHFGVE